MINVENYNRVEKNKYVTCYYLDDKLHRTDGPAEEYKSGTKIWFQNGLQHRIGGPSHEYSNGDKSWYQNGLFHRLDGPAYECVSGNKFWYYEGKRIDCNSQDEFERIIKLKLFW